MMSFWRQDPGDCPICGEAHTACTAAGRNEPIVAGKITAATSVVVPQPSSQRAPAPPLEAERVQATLPAGQFTTGTYRRAMSREGTKGGKS